MSRESLLVVVFALFPAVIVQAQPDRLTEQIDDQHRVAITEHLPKIAAPQADQRPVESSFLIHGTLFLKPSASQQAALCQLLLDLQDPHSSKYHQWLTPEEYALRFGISKSDAAKITDWLQTEGLTADQVARGRSWIAFHGTAGAMETAFHAHLHRYRAAKKRHFIAIYLKPGLGACWRRPRFSFSRGTKPSPATSQLGYQICCCRIVPRASIDCATSAAAEADLLVWFRSRRGRSGVSGIKSVLKWWVFSTDR
jgi:subtilase family serine protease